MKYLNSTKSNAIINGALNSLVLGLFFHFSLGNLVPIGPIFLFSALIIFIVRDLFLSLLAIIASLAFSSLLGHYHLTNQFIMNSSTRIFIGIFLMLSFVFAALLREFTQSKNHTIKLHFHLINFMLLIIFNYFFQLLNNQTSDKALRFLVYTGEDNAAWLNGLPIGFNPNGDNFFQVPQGTDIRSTTYSWLIAFRDIVSSFNSQKLITDNGLILQRFYFFIIFLTVLIVVSGILNLLQMFDLSPFDGCLTSFLVATAVYLSLASFAMFGHLTPILSLLHFYSAIIFILLFKKSADGFRKKIVYYLLVFLLIFTTKNVWYPLAPIIYLILFLGILKFISSQGYFEKIKSRKYLVIALMTVPFVYFAQTFDVVNFINLNFSKFINTVHLPGGSLVVGTLQIIAVFVFVYFYFSRSKSINEIYKIWEFRIIVLSFAIFYVFVICVSVLTPPYSIDYAGQKLGLLFIALFLPINIAFLVTYLLSKSKDYLKSIALSLGVLIFLIFAGSPTISGNPAWHQAAFPVAVFNRIESENTGIWEQILISEINNAQTSGKRVVCFNRYNETPDVTQSCSRFAQSLQGFFDENFSKFWLEVNWNNVSPTEFLQRKPTDFDDTYVILYLDNFKLASTENGLNSISNLLLENHQNN